MFRFAHPYYFLILLVIPIIIFSRYRFRFYPYMRVSTLSGVGDIRRTFFARTKWLPFFLKTVVLVLLVTAMARPQSGIQHSTVLTEGINIILAIDISGSMQALDFKLKGKIVNRLDAVKDVVLKFIAKRNGDRIGMVVFGTNAYTQVPLTRDYNTISFIMDRVEIGAAGKSTAIGDAIGISLKRLADIKSKSNVIILLTDGQSNAGELAPDVAAGLAAEKKVKIYTIGVGTQGEAPFPVQDVFGRTVIRYAQVDMDEDTLKMIAEKTGGMYFRAENTEGLEKIYDTIDRLEKTEVKIKSFAEYHELYNKWLIPALIILIVSVFLMNTRYLRIP